MKSENENLNEPQKPQLNIGAVSGSLFYQKVEKLVNEWKEKELGKTTPYSPEAEIEAGFTIFLRWLKERDVQ
jgi:hypothetical protein